MRRLRIALSVVAGLLGSLALSAQNFIVATDFFATDGVSDVADQLQKVIDDNPNRTIYIPDGTYVLSHPICTSADPAESVHLVLGNYAILKAAASWPEDAGAVVRCGAKKHFNTIYVDGSNYGIEGGIIDGNEVADGISIESGRETRLSRISIKHTRVGVHILYGANSGSSDADVSDVNIVGTGKSNSVGVLVEGHDNTFTNMRIAKVHVGVWLKRGGNSLRNIHPLYILTAEDKEGSWDSSGSGSGSSSSYGGSNGASSDSSEYIRGSDGSSSGLDGSNSGSYDSSRGGYCSSCGFLIESDNNFMNFCYSDQFATGFKIAAGKEILMTDCFAWWYYGKVPFQTAIACDGPFNSFVNGMRIGFSSDCPTVTFLKATPGGTGSLTSISLKRKDLSEEDVTERYWKK